MKISFSKLGQHGRLANQLFQVCSTIGIAEKHGAQAVFPEWQYAKYFNQVIPQGEAAGPQVKEQRFEYYDWGLTEDCDLLGYMQSEKYFPQEPALSFKPEFLAEVTAKMELVNPEMKWTKESILIHIRRGDYVGNPNYYQLPVTYYIDALITHFPGWRRCNIFIISDDIPYCRTHFGCLDNVYFADGFNDIESMAFASTCDNFILSNSSFSWWCAWLDNDWAGKVIHPGHMFTGGLARHNIKDFWPERWIQHKKDSYKIDLTDCTFTIPVYFDHKDRKYNLDLSVCMLQVAFDTHIIVGEQGSRMFGYMEQWAKYIKFELKHFHRTKMLNDMAKEATTPYIANWDCDVIIAPLQIYMTLLALREGADMVFPYDGRFARLHRQPWFGNIQRSLDIGVVKDERLTGRRGKPVPVSSVGGAVFFNKKSFIDGGMENEHMISFGPEDCERNDRFSMLGYKIERIGGPLFHIDHWIGPNSSTRNPYFRANHVELEKVRDMNRERLRAYVTTWPWRPTKVSEEEVNKVLQQYCEWAHEQTGWKYDVVRTALVKIIKA